MNETCYPPRHVAIIMDGNGRWAKKRGLPRLIGHKAGGDNIRPVVSILANRGVRYVTLYMFSTENWNRPRIEVTGLLDLLAKKIDRETIHSPKQRRIGCSVPQHRLSHQELSSGLRYSLSPP